MISIIVLAALVIILTLIYSKKSKATDDTIGVGLFYLLAAGLVFLVTCAIASVSDTPDKVSTTNITSVLMDGDYISVTGDNGSVMLLNKQDVEFVPSTANKIEKYSNNMQPWFVTLDNRYEYKIYFNVKGN